MASLNSVVIHCRDPYVLGPFWSVVTGLPIFPEDAEKIATRTLDPGESVLLGRKDTGTVHLWITPAERELLPVGRMHMDFSGTEADFDAILGAGATVVRVQEGHTVLADPEGNEFCFIRTGTTDYDPA